jgi:hypothetical protein
MFDTTHLKIACIDKAACKKFEAHEFSMTESSWFNRWDALKKTQYNVCQMFFFISIIFKDKKVVFNIKM